MIDAQLRRIIPKAAGTYFIVRDNRQVAEIEAESKMRLFFINTELGPTNVAVSFAKGDKVGFQNIFGKSTRKMKKAGNFSIDDCLEALSAGPITVVNLREFTATDKTTIAGFTANSTKLEKATVTLPYSKLFTTNTFWTPNYNKMSSELKNSLLSFGAVGTNDFSIFVVASKENYKNLTSEGENSLASTSIQIEAFPALENLQIKLKDTFVDVYLFATRLEHTNTNKYYGHLFSEQDELDIARIDELIKIPEAGFVRRFTGSVIPGLKSETGEEMSINTVINQYFMETGLICDINEDVLEIENDGTNPIIDKFGFTLYEGNTLKSSSPKVWLSHVLSETLEEPIKGNEKAVPTTNEENMHPNYGHKVEYFVEKSTIDPKKEFFASFEQGLRVGDTLLGENEKQPIVTITKVEVQSEHTGESGDFKGYTKVVYTADGAIKFDDTNKITKVESVVETHTIKPTVFTSVKSSQEKFVHGKGGNLNKVLDLMISPGIVRGVLGLRGIRYVVDCFRSNVEAGYKSQYVELVKSLEENNKFVRAILNEPFITDMMASTNPLFAQMPGEAFDLQYLLTGGNTAYSSNTLSKPSQGGEYAFFFGPGFVEGNNVLRGIAAKVSNLFYQKENAWDVVANLTGIIDGIDQLEYNFTDDERMYLEKFSYNPVILKGSTMRIFQNMTASPKRGSALKQITNSELLAYVKETLYNLADNEAFRKGNYDDYLRLETQCKDVMSALVQAGAIEPNPVVICSEKNNTKDIRQQKIKLVHVEFTPVDTLDKVVFDLNIN